MGPAMLLMHRGPIVLMMNVGVLSPIIGTVVPSPGPHLLFSNALGPDIVSSLGVTSVDDGGRDETKPDLLLLPDDS